MLRCISEEQTQDELKSCYKPTVFNSGFSILPFNNLGDREFELLSYVLVKEEIRLNQHKNFTDIVLMQGVGERGRDCVLYNNEKVCGVIQCKKYAGRLTKSVLLKELIKFSLYANQESSILPDINDFQYFIYVASDFTEPANTLLHSYKTSIQEEINNGNVEKYMEDIVNDYESFIAERFSSPFEKIKNILANLVVVPVNGVDLTERINKIPTILKNFFNIQTVVSVADADQIMRKALDDYGLRLLTDTDLKDIQERISSTAVDQRVSLGSIDFYGYSIEFFKSLKLHEFTEILSMQVKLNSFLYRKLLDFMLNETHKVIQEEVTNNLLQTGKIHPISVSLCAPYLMRCLIDKINVSSYPMLYKDRISDINSSEKYIEEQLEIIIATSKKILAEDYSNLVGNEYEINYKKEIFRHIHAGLKDIEDVRKQIMQDLLILKPILQNMEVKLKLMISEKRTILISDHSFFEDDTKLKKLFNTMSKLGNLS